MSPVFIPRSLPQLKLRNRLIDKYYYWRGMRPAQTILVSLRSTHGRTRTRVAAASVTVGGNNTTRTKAGRARTFQPMCMHARSLADIVYIAGILRMAFNAKRIAEAYRAYTNNLLRTLLHNYVKLYNITCRSDDTSVGA